jgi:hypothetical protein
VVQVPPQEMLLGFDFKVFPDPQLEYELQQFWQSQQIWSEQVPEGQLMLLGFAFKA